MARGLKKIAAALTLAGLCTQANAMPAAVAAVGVWMGGVGGAFLIMNATAVAIGLQVAGFMALGMYQRQKAKREARRQRDAYNASLTDRNTTVAEASPEVRHIYGRATVGGSVAAMFTRGDKDQIKDLVIAWAGHECDAVEDVLIAGESLQLDGGGNATASKWASTSTSTVGATGVFSLSGALNLPADTQRLVSITKGGGDEAMQLWESQYTLTGLVVQLNPDAMDVWAGQSVSIQYSRETTTSYVRVRHHLGAADQIADGQLIADSSGLPGAWTATDRLRGICYSVITLDLNNQELQSGLPQLTARIRGKKVLDPRNNATAWSDNPALCIYDFLRSGDYGKGVFPEQVEGVVAAANACDELVAVPGGTGTAKRYTCNGAWQSGTDPDNVLEDLCGAMAGYAIPGGTWGVHAGVYVSPVLVLGDDQAAGSINMVPAPSRTEAWNGVKGQFIDPAQFNQAVDFEPLQNAQYVEDDGGEVWGQIRLPFTDQGWRARTLGSISMEKSRAKKIVWRGTLACLRARVGDRVIVNNALLALSNATFRVIKRSYDHGSAAVELSLEQDEPRFYPGVSNTQPPAPGVQPDPTYKVNAPTGLVLTNPAPGRIGVHVDPSVDLRVTNGGALLIQVRTADSSAWVSMPSAPGNATDQVITVLQKGIYVVQVDWRASTGQQSGQWLAGAVTVTETSFATGDDVSSAVSGYANKENPVFTGVVGLPAYAIDNLPPAGGDNRRKAILVPLDLEDRPAVCVSDGTDWISQITGLPVDYVEPPPPPPPPPSAPTPSP